MSYFRPFPLVLYPVPGSDTESEWQVNLTRRTGVPSRFKTDPKFYFTHVVRDHETPEVIADKLYDNVNLAWIVLQFNDIVNLYEEWPKTQTELKSYINEKYEDPYAIHHYVSVSNQDLWVEADHPLYDRLPVTNYEYEEQMNDKKRNIKLPADYVVNEIVKQHTTIMSE